MPCWRRLLAKDPAARHQSFGDVRSALRRLSVDLSPAATLAPPAVVDRPASDGSARLIGRDAERAQLLQSLDQAKSGRGSLILLLGDAGVGKTRLAEEALAAARRLGCQTLVGRCYEQEGTPALIPYIEVLEEASRLMPAAVFRQAVGASAPELAKLMPELHRLFPDMAPPLELPPQLQQRFLFTNVREFLTRSSRFMPLVDLHRRPAVGRRVDAAADAATGAAAREPADRHHRRVPRGGELAAHCRKQGQASQPAGPGPRSGARGPHAAGDQGGARSARRASGTPARSRCARLRKPKCRALLAALGQPNPPARLVRKFADHTGGNPFFVAELFRHLKEEGRLFDARHQWTRDLDLDDVEVPDTVRVVLERRMQRVSTETQNVLRAAAVIGRHFEPDLLEEVAEIDGDTLIAALDEAEQARILRGPSGRRDITWRFAHQLTCQALTGAIPQLRRQRLHLRVADAMARLDRESRVYTSGIAHHLYCAGRLADPARTARALIAAGDAAHAVYATEEAVQHYRRALEVLQDTSGDAGDAACACRKRSPTCWRSLGDRAAAMEHYEQRRRRAPRRTGAGRSGAHRPQDRHAPLAGRRSCRSDGVVSARAGRCSRVQPRTSKPLTSIRRWGSPPFAAGTTARRSSGPSARCNRRSARSTEPASDAAQVRKAATAAIAHATNTIGVALARSGQLDAARERIERSLAAAQDLGLLDVACRAYANLGVLYSSVEPKRAIEVSLTGLEIASKIGAASLQSYIYANLAAAYCALTDRCETEGLQAAQAAAALDRELGQLDHLAVPLVVIAQIHQCRGELQKAQDAYREALALAERIGEPQLILPCYDGLATIYLDRGDRVRAEEFMEKARQLCERTGLDPDALLLLPFLC